MEGDNQKSVTIGELKKELDILKCEFSSELTKYAHEIIFPYIDEHCATKEGSDEMLKLQAEILKELKDLKDEKVVGDVQDKRKTKVLEIHNDALKRNKILSPEEALQIDQMRAF